MINRLEKTQRVESIDLLRGVVMVIMALDHTRHFFHEGAMNYNISDFNTTNSALFFTRFITHYCAPIFVFLAGTSAYLYGRNKPKKTLFNYLFSRGIWLIFLEIFLNNFLWRFNISYKFIVIQVLWAIGLSMICLSFLIYFRYRVMFWIGLLIVVGHNLLDFITFEGNTLKSIAWYLLHQRHKFTLCEGHVVGVFYPVLPWIGVIVLGYCFGKFYEPGFDQIKRKKYLLRIGISSILLFILLRIFNTYGDLVPWAYQKNNILTFLSFMDVTKYPPSFMYLLITLGPAFIFLYATEHSRNKASQFFIVFGSVPLFYYFLHMLFIHLAAVLVFAIATNHKTDAFEAFSTAHLNGYGFSLPIVYVVWVVIVLMLYPWCNWYMKLKKKNKASKILSYL
jgi:uncharacterized membrane protein